MYRETFYAIRIEIIMQFAKKIATLRNKNRKPAAKTLQTGIKSKSESLRHMVPLTHLIDWVNRAPREKKSPVFRKCSGKTLLFRR